MVPAGHEAVDPVGGAEHGQQHGRRRLPAGPEQQPDEERDAGQAHRGDGIGNGEHPVEARSSPAVAVPGRGRSNSPLRRPLAGTPSIESTSLRGRTRVAGTAGRNRARPGHRGAPYAGPRYTPGLGRDGARPSRRARAPAGMAPGLVALFAAACGISAANLYYAQPLLPLISRDLRVGSGTAALVVTGAQVGYGLGLALIVPLGDILVRRRLVPGILVVSAGRPAGGRGRPRHRASSSPPLAVAGLCSVAAQILVPFAATWPTTTAGPGGGHGDERAAARDPAGPDLFGPDRPGRRMAHRLRGGRGHGPGAGSAVLHAPAPGEGTPRAHRATRGCWARWSISCAPSRCSGCDPPSGAWPSPPST